MDVVKVRCLGSKKIEQFRYILTVGGKEWFIYSLIKVMKAVLMFLISSTSAQLLTFFFPVPLGCEQQTKMIATWVVTAIHCLVTQSSSERCVTWRQNELFTRTLCNPIFLWTRHWGGTNFYLTGVCFQKLFTEFCFVWRSIFFLGNSFWWFVFYLCGCTLLSLWAREYTTYKPFIFSSWALSVFRSSFFFPCN